MADAKVAITVGSISFTGEGEEIWVAKQLDKVLDRAPKLLEIVPAAGGGGDAPDRGPKVAGAHRAKGPQSTLAAFIKAKGGATNQTRRFLATAVWLHDRGTQRLTSRDVTTALSDNNQKRLGNPADCLNKNVSQGYCEKAGKQFYVTDEGRESLGTS